MKSQHTTDVLAAPAFKGTARSGLRACAHFMSGRETRPLALKRHERPSLPSTTKKLCNFCDPTFIYLLYDVICLFLPMAFYYFIFGLIFYTVYIDVQCILMAILHSVLYLNLQ